MFWNSRSRPKLESQVLELTNSARKADLAGQHHVAVQQSEAAMTMVRQLANEYPHDHEQTLGSLLYSQAHYFAGASRYDESLQALKECEEVYSRLPRDKFPVSVWLADVAARRGLIHARFGFGASAVTEMQWAVWSYMLTEAEPESPHYFDLARILADNAVVQIQFGDPDLAVASADTAVRMVLAQRDRINARPDTMVYSSVAVNALAVAATIHKAQGRDHISREATDLGRRFATHGSSVDALIAHNQELFRARRAPFGLSQALDMAATAIGREQVSEGLHDFAKLEERDKDTFPQVTPLDRFGTSLDLAPGMAAAIAEVAIKVMPRDADTGLRLGLEAHYLFAGASRAQTFSMRHQFQEFGPGWARVLLEGSRICHSRPGSKALALDLASWACGVAGQIMPIAASEKRSLVRNCWEHYGKLLIEAGKHPEGKEALNEAAKLGAAHAPGS